VTGRPQDPLLSLPAPWVSAAVTMLQSQWWQVDLGARWTNIYVRLQWGKSQIASTYRLETSNSAEDGHHESDVHEWTTRHTMADMACGLQARQDVLPPIVIDASYIRMCVLHSFCLRSILLFAAHSILVYSDSFVTEACFASVSITLASIKGYPLCASFRPPLLQVSAPVVCALLTHRALTPPLLPLPSLSRHP
jgi:hypothetical protein